MFRQFLTLFALVTGLATAVTPQQAHAAERVEAMAMMVDSETVTRSATSEASAPDRKNSSSADLLGHEIAKLVSVPSVRIGSDRARE